MVTMILLRNHFYCWAVYLLYRAIHLFPCSSLRCHRKRPDDLVGTRELVGEERFTIGYASRRERFGEISCNISRERVGEISCNLVMLIDKVKLIYNGYI